ncbi:Aste57867_25468 [Aphanomyces stellatus]|uniref:Aste57867_25468 protein n=1 Tax=Aphanomyces stellatus TaxID=120398 RepID=A0A485LTA2_9STRA|nr:hypothetical protein As57867_025389 [Aphanomyces stellatus]VFU02091.1 Aste57867_25468 [Aphanomyces stellatus]
MDECTIDEQKYKSKPLEVDIRIMSNDRNTTIHEGHIYGHPRHSHSVICRRRHTIKPLSSCRPVAISPRHRSVKPVFSHPDVRSHRLTTQPFVYGASVHAVFCNHYGLVFS